MKAVTLIQPWAWAIANAGKDVENRTWFPPRSLIGQRIAIHAGKKVDAGAIQYFREGLYGEIAASCPGPKGIARGAIAAVATLESVGNNRSAKADSPWFAGPVGWFLSDVIALKDPIPCKGAQGFWDVPPDVERALRLCHPAR